MALIPKPPFPNVPKLPGVPQLPRPSNFPAAPPLIVSLVAAGAQIFRAFLTRPIWGIYKRAPAQPSVIDFFKSLVSKVTPASTVITEDSSGLQTVEVSGRGKLIPVVMPDNIVEFGYRNEWNVSDYPVQDGSFASYNKVNNPFEVTLRMTKGGSVSDRQDFLEQIDAIAGTLDLYQIVTPEKTYENCNVIRYEVSRRGVKGAYFLEEVDLVVREIRTVDAQYTTTAVNTANAKDASAVGVTNQGTVNGVAPIEFKPGDFP